MSPAKVAAFIFPLLIVGIATAQDARPPQSTELFSLPHEVRTDIATHFNVLNSESRSTGQLPLQYGDVFVLPGRLVPSEGCYSMRAYRYAREEKGSDVTVPVAYTTCTPVTKFTRKSADMIGH